MRFRTTLLLLIVALGLGGYLYYVEMPSIEQEAKAKRLFDVKADDITELSLTYQDREVTLIRNGEEWKMTKPIEVAADAVAVKNIANSIAECESKKELKDVGSDLTTYGLDKPFVTVRVKAKGQELPTFVVGKNTPIGSNAYVLREVDKALFLTSSAFRASFDKQPKDLRDKSILNFADADVQRVEIRGADKHIRVTKKDEAWLIEQPGSYPADAVTMRTFLSSLRALRANDFPDPAADQLGTYGLNQPRLTVSLFLGKDNAQKDIFVGTENGDKKEIYVKTSGNDTVYTVSDWVMRDLNKEVNDLRDKSLLAFDRAALRAAEVKRKDGETYRLVGSDKDGWKLEGNDGRVAVNAASQWLGDLHDLKGYEVSADNPADLAAFGLDQPLLSVTLKNDQENAVGTVLIGEHNTEQGTKEYFAMAQGGPTVFKIRDYLITRLNKRGPDFLEVPTPTVGPGTPAGLADMDEMMELDAAELGE